RGAWHQCDGAHDRLLALDHRTDAGAWPHPRQGREDARPRDARGPLHHRAAPARHRDPTGGVALEDATTSGRGGRYVRSAAGNAEVTETRSVWNPMVRTSSLEANVRDSAAGSVTSRLSAAETDSFFATAGARVGSLACGVRYRNVCDVSA